MMRIRLKSFPIALFILSVQCLIAQPATEIVLVGVFHHIPDSLACNWSSTYQKMLRYTPDQIAVEEVIPTDTFSLYHSVGPGFAPIWDSLEYAWEGRRITVEDSIRHYQQLLSKVEHPEWRLRLWKYYHLGLDIGNREYQTYLIHQNPGKYLAQLDTHSDWGKIFWSRYQRTIRYKKESEFFNLIYPLAQTLGLSYLHPTDNKATYTAQSQAYENFSAALEGTPSKRKLEEFWNNFIDSEQNALMNCRALDFVNSTSWLLNTDYGQAHLLDNLNLLAYSDYARIWYYRNETMAERVIQAAKQSKAKKMAVFYGYMHIFPVKKYLEDRGYKVKLIGELE